MFRKRGLAWYRSAATECELDPGVRKIFFREGVGESTRLLGLESHLGERTLDIEVLEIPGAFRLKEKEGLISLFVFQKEARLSFSKDGAQFEPIYVTTEVTISNCHWPAYEALFQSSA